VSEPRESMHKPSANNQVRDYAVFLITAGVLAAIDQLTKYVVRTNLPRGQVFLPAFWLTQYARIVHWYNTGVTGGMFENMNMVFIIIVSVLIGILLIVYPSIVQGNRLLSIAMSLILGGGVGNLIDRLLYGHVTDFISIEYLGVFNLADVFIVVGASLLIYGLWQRERKSKNGTQSQDDNAEKPTVKSPSMLEDNQGE
jgi:signal peptidase II